MSQAAGAKGLEVLVHLSADPADLGLGDAGVHPEGAHQVVDLARRDPVDVGLHDHGVEGLVDAPAPLEDRGKEAARAQLGDLEVHVAGLGREHREREPLRLVVRVTERSWGSARTTSVASASINA